MKDIVIIKTGDSIPSLVTRRGDFEDWIIAGIGARSITVRIVAVHKGEIPPDPDLISGIIITGSHAMVTDQADWMETTKDWLMWAVNREIPVLGICFGHQLLAHALGGQVGYMPGGPEYGTVSLSLTTEAQSDPLFDSLPDPVGVQTSHYQSVTKLPSSCTLLGSTEEDPHSAFRHGRCTWGVQFHPEYDADIANSYIDELNKNLANSRGDEVAMLCDCRETVAGRIILGRFAEFAAEWSVRILHAPDPGL